LVAWRSW